MTVAIKRSNGDLFWFDAVLSFGRQLSGGVSKHPLETGAVITDHTTIDNEVITLRGVLSDADFNLRRPTIGQQQAEVYGITDKQFMNNTPITGTSNEVQNTIVITEKSTFTKYLPDVIGQFLSTTAPEVKLADGTPRKVMPAAAVQGYLEAMMTGREQFTLLSFENGTIQQAFDNCVMTSLSFNEDPDSGFAVYPDITIERVRYATSASAKIKKRVAPAIAKKAATSSNKGKQPTTGGACDPTLAPNKPQTNSTKTSGSVPASEAAKVK